MPGEHVRPRFTHRYCLPRAVRSDHRSCAGRRLVRRHERRNRRHLRLDHEESRAVYRSKGVVEPGQFMRVTDTRWRRWLGGLLLVLAAVLCLAQTSTPNPPQNKAPDRDDIIQLLNQTITWYRQLEPQQRLATEPSDALVVSDNHRLAQQAIQLA